MVVSLKHFFQSGKVDGTDSTLVQPSHWNAEHVLLSNTATMLGRMAAGVGPVQELPVFVDATGQSLNIPFGTTAQRPASPQPGMMRYNTTLQRLEAYQGGIWGNFADIALSPIPEQSVLGRAKGTGTGTPTGISRKELQRIVYNVGTYYPTGNTVADDGFVLGFGQNLSRVTYAELFAKYGTLYGVGDGVNSFGIPDLRGRVLAGKDNMGGTSADRLVGSWGGVNGDILGAVGGLEYHIITAAQLAKHQHSGTTAIDSPDHYHPSTHPNLYGSTNSASNRGWAAETGVNGSSALNSQGTSVDHKHAFNTDVGGGSDGAHNNVQPTFIVNWQIYTGVHA